MILIYISMIFTTAFGWFIGKNRRLRLHALSTGTVLWGLMIAASLILAFRLLQNIGIASEELLGAIMANAYSTAGGAFAGAFWVNFSKKKNAGWVKFVNHSFLVDVLPLGLAASLFLFGLYRTQLLGSLPATPIRIGSGFSIMLLAVWALSIQIVPQFREKGIIYLDILIPWDNLLSYSWHTGETLELEYEQNDEIRTFVTVINPENQSKIEQILAQKMIEKLEEKEV